MIFKKIQKMEKNLYRGYILVAHKMGKTPVEIFNELSLAYSDAAPCYMTVCRLGSTFQRRYRGPQRFRSSWKTNYSRHTF